MPKQTNEQVIQALQALIVALQNAEQALKTETDPDKLLKVLDFGLGKKEIKSLQGAIKQTMGDIQSKFIKLSEARKV